MARYSGFSTVNPLSQKNFRLTDHELIKQDLLNSINTRRGTRLMLPREGCIVWELLFEPLTEQVVNQITENFTYIINADPRVSLKNIDVTALEDENFLLVDIELLYVDTDQTDTMKVLFDRQAITASVV